MGASASVYSSPEMMADLVAELGEVSIVPLDILWNMNKEFGLNTSDIFCLINS